MQFPNYVETINPFGLARPPAWFLRQLLAYDALLRVFPSTCKPVYQVGRQGRHGGALTRPNPKLPDTIVFAAHGIWPWKEVMPQTIGFGWQKVLDDLPDYDTQRFRDPAGTLDANEAQRERELELRIADEAEQRGADFYRTLQLIDGQRVGSGARPEGAGYTPVPGMKPRARRRRAYRPVGAGAGAMFVGR
jgi:hypothetical protein